MYLVGIAGGSGSGKTTFAKKIIQRVQSPNVILLSQDSYYLPSAAAHLKVHGEANFDHPESFDWPLLRDHLARLKSGESVSVPVYDYKTSSRTSEVHNTGQAQVILLEGIFTLWDEPLRDLFDLKVYIHVEADIRFIRRLHRDVKDRGRTHDEVIRRYYDTVRPMHQLHLEPTRKYADVIVGEESDIASDLVTARVKELLATYPHPKENHR
ncbi:MAG: uridine kinase [Proteobacteria bacterium]|nr:MAG: uridine kinase [Pseudomonadota bacterium]